jgi:hypothetical protein
MNLWHEIVRLTLERGGLTIDPKTGEVYDNGGYAVGGFVPSKTIPVGQNWHDTVREFVQENASVFNNGHRMYLGTWIDGDTVWLDVSAIFEDKDEAIAVARANGEKAIWDFDNATEIYV